MTFFPASTRHEGKEEGKSHSQCHLSLTMMMMMIDGDDEGMRERNENAGKERKNMKIMDDK